MVLRKIHICTSHLFFLLVFYSICLILIFFRLEIFKMKEISFDDVQTLNFPHTSSCMLFHDLDEDGVVELSVGSREGFLSVYKTNSRPDLDSRLVNPAYQYVSLRIMILISYYRSLILRNPGLIVYDYFF